MRLLIVQLSDIHFQATSNPIEDRIDKLASAILAIVPRPEGCLVLVTGDISYSGEPGQFSRASSFFDGLRRLLEVGFGAANVKFDYIPGNHDCILPKDEVEVRSAIVDGARERITVATPDTGFLRSLLSAQEAFFEFYSTMTGKTLAYAERICRSEVIELATKHIRLISLNSALLSQREEKAGTLYLPESLLNAVTASEADVDATVCVYHHPSNWFEPNFHRRFRKSVEASAHLVFTGHEHQQDDHWTEASSGEHTAYIEADALQDRAYPKKSGFNCLVIDFTQRTQSYYHYRWKGDMYAPVMNGKLHSTTFDEKSSHRFDNTQKFVEFLTEDDFGFSHPTHSDLKLADFFTFQPLSINSTKNDSSNTVPGSGVAGYLYAEPCVHIHGQERAGKTSLLKMLYSGLIQDSAKIPVLLQGAALPSEIGDPLYKVIDGAVRAQYGESSIERFRQLSRSQRVIMIDDFHKSKLKGASRAAVIVALKNYSSTVIVTSNELPEVADYEPELTSAMPLFSKTVTVKELPPSSRAEIVDKWLRLGQLEERDEATHIRESQREQNFLSELIRTRALPSLPYLVVGVLQIRLNKRAEVSDPGSFGYLFQRLVIDALNITKSAKPHIDRKEGILRRFAFNLFRSGENGGSKADYDAAVASYAHDIRIKVDGEAIYADLIIAKVLMAQDGRITFRHSYFFHFFVAKQLLDDVDSASPDEARTILNDMADRPLTASNQLTLMFFLFFKKRDPIIDRLIMQADQVFQDEPMSDIANDVRFIDEGIKVLQEAQFQETVDIKAEATKRLGAQDKAEENKSSLAPPSSENPYSAALNIPVKLQFAVARMELLGQVVRSFSGSLDGPRKQEILEGVFKLGLRSLHATLGVLADYSLQFTPYLERIEDKDNRERITELFNRLIALLARLYCDSTLLNISRAVGVSDIEEAYEAAIAGVGDTCATQLLELAIKLDHSEEFPFKLLSSTKKRVSLESRLASIVLTDLVVRNITIFPWQRETLRRIGIILRINPAKTIEASTK